MELDEKQVEAINACLDIEKRLVAVTGKAGTGKTTLIKNIYTLLKDAGYQVACSAPTGKAAKRIQEATGIPAVTNHKLLGYGMPYEVEVENDEGKLIKTKVSTGPQFKRNNPLPYDVILCDEYAMVNHEIHRNLIDALKPGAAIRMFGDVNQLKPIEENKLEAERPTPFQTVLEKHVGIELNVIHRQAEGSGIAENGSRILRGVIPQRFPDFFIHYTDQPINKLKDYILERGAEHDEDFSKPEFQILTTMNKTWVGVLRLNQTIQTLYWDNKADFMELPRHQWGVNKTDNPPIRVQVGSKVVFTTNIYDLYPDNHDEEVQYAFNGEVGNIVALHEDGSVSIDFGDRVVMIPPLVVTTNKKGNIVELDPRKSIDLAYVLTTHKAQGSQYNHVVVVLNKSTSFSQSRRNFYTAITRASKVCTVITDQYSISKSTKYKD